MDSTNITNITAEEAREIFSESKENISVDAVNLLIKETAPFANIVMLQPSQALTDRHLESLRARGFKVGYTDRYIISWGGLI